MNPKKVIITYFLLMLTLLGSAAFFAYEIKFFMRERGKDPTKVYIEAMADPGKVDVDIQNSKKLDQQSVLDSVGKGQAFIALATPVPRPTPTMRPEPSPTPIIPAKGYNLVFATSTTATLKSYKGSNVSVRVGDTVPEDLGAFKILEITQGQNPRVKVQDIKTGQTGFLTKEGTK